MGNEHNGATRRERLAQVEAMLKSRIDMKGDPKPGYKNNVQLCRSEIERLKSEIARGLN